MKTPESTRITQRAALLTVSPGSSNSMKNKILKAVLQGRRCPQSPCRRSRFLRIVPGLEPPCSPEDEVNKLEADGKDQKQEKILRVILISLSHPPDLLD